MEDNFDEKPQKKRTGCRIFTIVGAIVLVAAAVLYLLNSSMSLAAA